MNAHALAPWWELLKDFLIPVAAILIPTLIAVKLARDERVAAHAAREDDRRIAEQEAVERSRRTGAIAALETMEELLKAAAQTDSQRRAEMMAQSRILITTITMHLRSVHLSVWTWMLEELTVVARGVTDRGENDWPVHYPEIERRHTLFNIIVLDWLEGEKNDAWFDDRATPPLAQTHTLRPS